ncbi:MAG: InlB B-repeat-containing protein [Christensenellales bacterium]
MKKKLSAMLSLLICLLLGISLAACDNGKNENDGDSAYTITFDSRGGSTVSPISGKAGESVSAPAGPMKSGERFCGWYESADGGVTLAETEFSFSYMPAKNITLYAKWQDAVIGSWETYQVVMPARSESEEDIVVNLGEEFPFLGTTLSEDLFNLTVGDTDLTLIMTAGESTMSDSATYTKNDGVYVASLTIMGDTVYTLTTYDGENDRLLCEIRDKEGEGYTIYYKLTFTRVKG